MSVFLSIVIILILVIVFFLTYKSNKMIINTFIVILFTLSIVNIFEITKLSNDRNSFAYYSYEILSDSLNDIESYKNEKIENIEAVYKLSDDIDNINKRILYFEKNINNLKIESIDKTELRINLVKLKISLEEFSNHHRGVIEESKKIKIENNLELYNSLIDELVVLSKQLNKNQSIHHNLNILNLNISTYELNFGEKDGDVISETIFEIEKLILDLVQ